MRETAVRLLGVAVIANTLAHQLKFGFEASSSRLALSVEPFEFSGPGFVALFEGLAAPGVFWFNNFPYLIGVGLLLCFASKPISRLIAPRGCAA